jgi:hypothetical protein
VCVCVCVWLLLLQSSGTHITCAILYCHLRPLWLYHILPQYLINGTIFRRKLLNTKCTSWFSLQLLTDTFLILWIIQRDIINVQMYSDNLIPELPSTAHSCSRDGAADVGRATQRYTCSKNIYSDGSMSTLFHAIKSILLKLPFFAQTCQFYDNVFETDRKGLELRALCLSPYQLDSSSLRCQGSSYVTRIIHSYWCKIPVTFIRC